MSNLFSTGGAGNVGASGITQQSLKFNDDESQYLSWTPAAAGNQKTWTWSAWVKRANIGTNQTLFCGGTGSTLSVEIRLGSDNKFHVLDTNNTYLFSTTQLFRDVSSWYHFVIECDTTQATVNDRTKLYVNGEQVTSFSTDNRSNFSQNEDTAINSVNAHYIARWINGGGYFDGYLSDVYFIDGQALDPTSFGQFNNGYWEAKDYAGIYGTNGFHLTFADDVVSEGFNAVTYRGTGADQSISGLGFSPDLVWIKDRTDVTAHYLFDVVRGALKDLYSNLTAAEYSAAQTLKSFDGDGFTVGNNTGVNGSADDMVAWAWDAGSGSAASNTDGSITSTVKANPSYGFSVVSWVHSSTTSTIGHGLTTAANLIILKSRTTAYNWDVGSDAIGWGNRMILNSTAASSGTAFWNSTAPTSSVFTYAGGGATNGDNMIAYCFAEVAGYSSIGTYSGTGASGNDIACGFRPNFVMVKKSTNTGAWSIFDGNRFDSDNNFHLLANGSDTEYTDQDMVFTDTGFTVGSAGGSNHSGETFIYMAFADTREAAFWKDVSGNNNHWTPNNLDYRDSLIDSPANNWCTLNPLLSIQSTFSEGNLKTVTPSNAGNSASTIAMSEGKWYAEFVATSSGTVGQAVGVVQAEGYLYSSNMYESTNKGIGYYSGNGQEYDSTSGSLVATGYGSTWTTGDVIGVAYDADNSQITFYKNGVSQGTVTLNATISAAYFSCGEGQASATTTFVANFGQDSTFSGTRPAGGNVDDNGIGDFAYPVPSGFLSLCSASLPTPSIVDGSEHFNTVLWTGDGSQTRSLTAVNFQPDFSWLKIRSGTTQDHQLYDSVRGAGSGKNLSSNTTAVEGTVNTVSDGDYGFVSSFDADGFSVDDGAIATTGGYVNYSGRTYVAWNWKAGGTAVSNTAGSITSQVSAGEYMSICTWTGNGTSGATIGHGLGKIPSMLIVKRRNTANGWPVYHEALGTGSEVYLNYSQGATSSNFWITSPTSSVFSVSNSDYVNTSSDTYVGYAFANLDGACKVGSYTGNGSGTDAPFVFTGFSSAFVLIKNASGAGNWLMFDNKREGYNPCDVLYADDPTSEETSSTKNIDILSNGFKIGASTNANINTASATYIYMAFASTPLKFSPAR
jgi:hypothetical protein